MPRANGGEGTSPRRPPLAKLRREPSPSLGDPLRQLADGFFQQRPRLVAVFSLPLGIESGRTQFFPEWRDIRLVEYQPFPGQFLPQPGIELCNIDPLVNRGRVAIFRADS